MTAKLDERFNQTSEALNQYKVDLRKSIGNIMSPLLWLPLKNSLDMITGTGSVTFSRASTATYIDRYGVLKYASIDEPRFEKEGLLIEGPSTNLLLYSEDFSNSVWSKMNGLTVTSNTSEVTAPDGSNNADIIEDTDNTQQQWIRQGVIIPDDNSTYTFSVFVKKKTSNICIIQTDLRNGTNEMWASILVNLDNGDTTLRTDLAVNNPYSYKVKYIEDGWYRVSVSIQNNSTGNTTLRTVICPAVSDMSGDYDHEATGSIYVWGAQLEKLPFASSYIPTTDSAVTRAKDVCYVDALNNVPIAPYFTDGTIVMDVDILGPNNINEIHKVNYIFSYNIDYTTYRGWFHLGGLVLQYMADHYGPWMTTGPIDKFINNTNRICMVHKSNGISKGYVNDVKFSEVTNQLPDLTSGDKLFIGTDDSRVLQLFGHISNFRIYDRALTDEEVALL